MKEQELQSLISELKGMMCPETQLSPAQRAQRAQRLNEIEAALEAERARMIQRLQQRRTEWQ